MIFCNGLFFMFQNKKVIMSLSYTQTSSNIVDEKDTFTMIWALCLGHEPRCIVERFSKHFRDERFNGQEAKSPRSFHQLGIIWPLLAAVD